LFAGLAGALRIAQACYLTGRKNRLRSKRSITLEIAYEFKERSPMQPADEWLEIGKIVGPQGLKGEVRIYPNTDFPERFLEPGKRWLLRPGATQPETIDLVSGRYLGNKGLYVVKFAEVDDCNTAEALRGGRILIDATDRPILEPNEFHVLDLLGLAVYDQATQQLIGTVTDVISAGNDLLEVQRPDPEQPNRQPGKVLIPFVQAIVPFVGLQEGRIEITPPPGLID
jgi:16S rRNA processing protein RimM